MDLFPDGGFVRLRNRARGKYVYADEDASGVSLRPLGSEPSLNTVWKVKLWSVEGANFILLQGSAYSRYLAVSNEEERPPSGHLGVRAVQHDYNSVSLDDFMWRAVRVEAGKNYVRLRNYQRYLRANGRHRHWNNLVTVDDGNSSETTTMMQWKVEAIPSTLLQLPLPPPPQPPCKDGCCYACGREGCAALCRRCAEAMKKKLLAVAKRRMDEERAHNHHYCLECHEIFTGNHAEHRDKCISIGKYKHKCVAWVTDEKPWRPIFGEIETKDRAIRPYLLYKSGDPRCTVCLDIVSPESLYGTLLSFCSLKCFVAGGGGQEMTLEAAIVRMDFLATPIGFCLTCATAVSYGGGKAHKDHDWFHIRTDLDGLRPRVVIPDGHPKQQAWVTVKKEGPANNEVLIKDDASVRCNCSTRLASACAHSCSLQRALDTAGKVPRFLPRPLQLSSHGADAKTV